MPAPNAVVAFAIAAILALFVLQAAWAGPCLQWRIGVVAIVQWGCWADGPNAVRPGVATTPAPTD